VAYTDFNAFREVWNLNEKRLFDLVLKILEADRVVMEQELGKTPKPPHPDVLKRWVIGTEEFEDLTKTPQAPSADKEAGGASKKESFFMANKSLSEPLEHLWRLVSDEVGFLVDERIGALIGLAAGDDIATSTQLVRIDLLLQDLGVTQAADVEQLLSYFVQDQEFFELETPGFVRPCQILEALRRFVDAYHPNAQQNQASLFAQITADATQNTSSEVARAILQLQQKMRKQLPLQRKFIEKKTEVVTEEMWRVWNAAFKVMQRYVKELEERAKLIEETDKLKQQNREFEMMLSRCVESENNDMLIYPPAQTVDFQTE
jgi:dynein regulatory complex protein 1